MAAINDLTPSLVMSGLALQRDGGILCDVELQAEGKLIPAHRAVLASASPFFYGMFTSEFREKNEKVIPLEDITFEALDVVIDSMYKFNIQLTVEIVPEVLVAAHMLQIAGIIEKCKEHMIGKMSVATCFTFLAVAEKYELKDVIAKANEFVLGNFVDVSKSEEFKAISKEALCNYLSSDTLNFKKNEVEVFEAARRWLETDDDRMQYVGEVMKNVRFMLINVDKLGEISDSKIVENNMKCQKLIRDALVYQAKVMKQPLIVTDQNRPRGKRDILTINGGMKLPLGFKNTQSETIIYHGTGNCKTSLKSVFFACSMTAVQVNNFLFLFAVDKESLSPVTMRYNASTDEWMDLLPCPRQATISSAAAVVNDSVYLVGGLITGPQSARVSTENIARSGHVYSISANKWGKIADMPHACFESAASSIGMTLYVSGGVAVAMNNLGVTEKVFAYDISAALWLTKPPMIRHRQGHMMEAIDTKLYVFGGMEAFQFAETVECYDAVTEQWTVVKNANLKICRGCSFVDGNIFITGGGNGVGITTKIMKFDVKSHKISEEKTSFAFPQAGHFSALMILPQLL